MMNHIIPKPKLLTGYTLHRMVAELAKGQHALYCDNGDHLLVRTARPITPSPAPVVTPASGSVIAFHLKACVADRKGGRNIYPEIGDWRARRAWLEQQGGKCGFEVIAVHVDGGRQDVVASNGRKFWIDATRFAGVLKVIDEEQFATALARGVGRVGKAFGMGLLDI